MPSSPYLSEFTDGNQFERFARDFLRVKNFRIEEGPGEGPDAGKDIIVSERLQDILGNGVDYRWLVSCKYRATGAINVSQEQAIIDRLQHHKCNGFIGFYSTWPSSGLLSRLEGLKQTTVSPIHMFEFSIIDGDQIMQYMLADKPAYIEIAQNYLPSFYNDEIRSIVESSIARGDQDG